MAKKLRGNWLWLGLALVIGLGLAFFGQRAGGHPVSATNQKSALDLPEIRFASKSVTVSNNAKEILIAVRLSKAAKSPVTVDYEAIDGTAKAGVDFVAIEGKLTFPPGSTKQVI
ncbi:MAG: Calx-beta domain-containing protein, partial [Candidatus Acidiferrum sp.]